MHPSPFQYSFPNVPLSSSFCPIFEFLGFISPLSIPELHLIIPVATTFHSFHIYEAPTELLAKHCGSFQKHTYEQDTIPTLEINLPEDIGSKEHFNPMNSLS